jgi:hypothetical protein
VRLANWLRLKHVASVQIATTTSHISICSPIHSPLHSPYPHAPHYQKRLLALAAKVGVVEPQARLAGVGDGVAFRVEITGSSFVADGAGTPRAGVAVGRGDLGDLASGELASWRGGREAEGGDEEGNGVHVDLGEPLKVKKGSSGRSWWLRMSAE